MQHQALTRAFSHIYTTIPRELLALAFPVAPYSSDSIDEQIRKIIIRGRVLIDVNTSPAGGRPAKIPLLSTYLENTDELKIRWIGPGLSGDLYRIPESAREGREILAVERLDFAYANTNHDGMSPLAYGYSGNNIINSADMMLRSRTLENANTTPTPILREGNIVQVSPRFMTDGLLLFCRLAYDDEFTNMPQGCYEALTELIVCAVKQYIHTQLIIKIDQAQVHAGAQIGRIRELVDRYEQEGSQERYSEILQRLKGGAIMDPETLKRLFTMMI
jgi:hypothetical protein